MTAEVRRIGCVLVLGSEVAASAANTQAIVDTHAGAEEDNQQVRLGSVRMKGNSRHVRDETASVGSALAGKQGTHDDADLASDCGRRVTWVTNVEDMGISAACAHCPCRRKIAAGTRICVDPSCLNDFEDEDLHTRMAMRTCRNNATTTQHTGLLIANVRGFALPFTFSNLAATCGL